MRPNTNPIKIMRPTYVVEGGKLQPQALDLEEVVLGAIMLEKGAIGKVLDILKPEMFYKESHMCIYAAIERLVHSSRPVDILTVTNELKRSDELELAGGAYYITQLTNRIASSEHIQEHAHIVIQKYMQREIIRASTEQIRQAYNDTTDVFDLLDKSYSELNAISSQVIRTPAMGSSKLFGDFIKRLEMLSLSESDITGVPCTLRELNKVTKGWQKSDLIVVAARPGMGKSAFVKTVINGAIQKLQKPVLLFSLEMSKSQQIARLLSEDVNIPSDDFNSKAFLDKTGWNEINSVITKYFDKNGKDLLLIDDTGTLHINELRARAKKAHSEHGLSCIIVDYMQKASADSPTRTIEIGQISWGLKTLAKELDIPVIVLSQLSRKVEERTDKRPQLSDLRDSGEIEQDADMVLFLYRPEYYGISELDDGSSANGYAEIIIAKHRNGALATVGTKFTGHLTKFEDRDDTSYQNPNPYNASAGLQPSNDFVVKKKKTGFEDDTPPF